MSSLLRYTATHPCRPPHWRWERARLIREHGPRFSPTRDPDRWVRASVQLGHRLKAAADDIDRAAALSAAGPLGLAYDLWDGEHTEPKSGPKPRHGFTIRHEIEARLLCGQPFTDIASRLDVETNVVQSFESVFFHVTDRLDRPSYVLHQVIGPAIHQTMTAADFPTILKAYAYFSRSGDLVDALTTTFAGASTPRSRDEVIDYMAEDWRWTASRKSALSVRMLEPSGKFVQEKLLEIRSRMDEVSRQGDQDAPHVYHQNIAVALANVPWLKDKPGALPVNANEHRELRASEHVAQALGYLPKEETPNE